MIKLLQQLKTVRLGVWILCVFIIYVGGTVIDILTTPMSSSEMAWREERYYDNHYNRTQPNEKTPVYDYKKYHMIKLDGRYFLIPRAYGGFEGVYFFWPKKMDYMYKSVVTNDKIFLEKRNKATIEVFMNSRNFGRKDVVLIDSEHACVIERKNQQSFWWNGLIIKIRFDDSHLAEWPQICQEALRILSLVKEVKNHD